MGFDPYNTADEWMLSVEESQLVLGGGEVWGSLEMSSVIDN